MKKLLLIVIVVLLLLIFTLPTDRECIHLVLEQKGYTSQNGDFFGQLVNGAAGYAGSRLYSVESRTIYKVVSNRITGRVVAVVVAGHAFLVGEDPVQEYEQHLQYQEAPPPAPAPADDTMNAGAAKPWDTARPADTMTY